METIIVPLSSSKIYELPLYINSLSQGTISSEAQLEGAGEHYFLLLCETGMINIEVNDESLQLSEDMAILIHKNLNYTFYAFENTNVKIITFNGFGVDAILDYLHFKNYQAFRVNSDFASVGYYNIINYVRIKDFYKASLELQDYLRGIRGADIEEKSIHDLSRVNQFIHEHYCETIELAQLAEIQETSISYLCRIYKKTYGISPINYVNVLRVNRAKWMLAASQTKITEVAEKCGFLTLEYFCYVFKQREKCTPLQYRKMWLAQKKL